MNDVAKDSHLLMANNKTSRREDNAKEPKFRMKVTGELTIKSQT